MVSDLLNIRANGVNIDIPINDFIEHAGAGSESTVLVSGTLVTGLGNIQSDFDVHVFSNERPLITRDHFHKHDWISDGTGSWVEEKTFQEGQRIAGTWDFWDKLETSIDIKFWTYAEIEAMCEAFRTKYDTAVTSFGFFRNTDYLQYGIGDGTAFAKILSGKCIQNQDRFESVLARFGLKEYCYLAYRYHMPLYDDFRDIVGSWRSGDFESAVMFARIYLELTSWSLSHVLGDPNTNRKWICGMTRLWPESYHGLGADYRALSFAPLATDEDKQAFVVSAVNWCDDAFLAMTKEIRHRAEYHDLEEMALFIKQKILLSGRKSTEEQSRIEWDWYRRMISDDFILAKNLL